MQETYFCFKVFVITPFSVASSYYVKDASSCSSLKVNNRVVIVGYEAKI